MWASLARSFEQDEQDRAEEDEHGMVSITVGIRMRDENPRIAVQAVNTTNLAAVAISCSWERFFTKVTT